METLTLPSPFGKGRGFFDMKKLILIWWVGQASLKIS
jgi:hypothetical protein